MKKLLTVAAAAAAVGLHGCGGGANAVAPPITKAPIQSASYATLQFAVGTANIAGQTGLNTVVTLRQNANGLTAYGDNTPVITWDGNFTNTGATGSNVDKGTNQISGTLPVNPVGSAAATPSTFGTSYGAFGYGFVNSNSTTTGNGTIRYPCLPLYPGKLTAPGMAGGNYGNCAAGAQYVGGPPAFPQIHGAQLTGQMGAFLGFTPFAGVTPAPNPATGTSAFNLQVTVETATSGNVVLNAPATMRNFTPLPTFTTLTFTPNGTGGGSFAYSLPAGVTEAYLILVDWGPTGDASTPSCSYGVGPFFYTVRVTPGSPNPIALGDNLGATPAVGPMPAARNTHTICNQAENAAVAAATGGTDPASPDQVQVFGVGFDYPAYASAYPQSNGNASPPITGTNGQADITMTDIGPITPATAGTAIATMGRSRVPNRSAHTSQ